MGFLDRVLQRNPEEQVSRYLGAGDAFSSKHEWKKAVSAYKKAVTINKELCENKRQQIMLAKLGYALLKNRQYSHAQDIYCQAGQLALDLADYRGAAEYFISDSVSAINADKIPQFQVALLLAGLASLVSGNIETAVRIREQIRQKAQELQVKSDLPYPGKPGEILDALVTSIIKGRVSRQTLAPLRNSVSMLKLPKTEAKLVDLVLRMLERRLKAKLVLSSSFIMIPVGQALSIHAELIVDPSIKIGKYSLKCPPEISPGDITPKKGRFMFEIEPLKQGIFEIGPLSIWLKDKTGYQFKIESNVLELQAIESVSDMKLGIHPVSLPVGEKREAVISAKNIGNTTLYDLDFNFSFSPNIRVSLGSTKKRVNSLGPNEVIRFPFTVQALGGLAGHVTARYQYEDNQNQVVVRDGTVTLTFEDNQT
ncbi:MAG: hypothetical protein ACTSW4_07740 [Candidatus Ranarchaeia archaeon]